MTPPAVLELTAYLFWVLRLAAGVGAAIVGWLFTGPVVRVIYRGAFQRPVPPRLVPWTKLGGAVLLGLLVFWYLPLGGGGGLGWGPGDGGGPGLGPGDGPAKKGSDEPSTGVKSPLAKKGRKDLETLEIELIGGARYKNDGRFYLLKRQEPVVPLDEVDDYLNKNKERLDEYVIVILTPDSVAPQHGAVLRLNTIIEKYQRIPQIKNVNKE
jgi:hypothetical protein